MSNKLSDDLKAIISGASSGAIGFSITLPIDYIKQHMQTNRTFTQVMKDVEVNGTKILFRGGTIGLTSIAPQMAIKYYAFHKFNYSDNVFTKPVSAFGAGLVDGAFLGPVLAFQSFRQMNVVNQKVNYKTIVSHNFAPLMVPMALRNATYTSSILGGYFIIKEKLFSNKPLSFFQNILIGSILNVPATLFCSPFDVLRANHNNQLLNYQINHPLTKPCLKKITLDIYKKNGFKGFYTGYPSLLVNFALRFPLTLALQFEILKLIS